MSLATIMDDLADSIRNALTQQNDEVQVLARRTFTPTPLCVDMFPADPSQERNAFGAGSWDLFLTVRARVSTADNEAGQGWLLDLADPTGNLSLQAALDGETFSNSVAQVVCGPPSGQRIYEDVIGQGGYLGCEWNVRIVT